MIIIVDDRPDVLVWHGNDRRTGTLSGYGNVTPPGANRQCGRKVFRAGVGRTVYRICLCLAAAAHLLHVGKNGRGELAKQEAAGADVLGQLPHERAHGAAKYAYDGEPLIQVVSHGVVYAKQVGPVDFYGRQFCHALVICAQDVSEPLHEFGLAQHRYITLKTRCHG